MHMDVLINSNWIKATHFRNWFKSSSLRPPSSIRLEQLSSSSGRGKTMATQSDKLISRSNVITGRTEWDVLSPDYDYAQEIACSAYADMLHDSDRNRQYDAALRQVIGKLKSAGRSVHVLDIGTGTGLLSMMAVRCGADRVTACEAFAPVASCARRVLEVNELADKIKLVGKRSTELVVGLDMPERANVLVAEVFDTELIGEDALQTFKHAAQHLLTTDAIVIPSSARVYIQVAESPFLWEQNKLISFPGPPTSAKCSGCPSVYDLQISELEESDFTLLTPRVLLWQFDFFPESAIVMDDRRVVLAPVERSGKAQVFFIWWELVMEPSDTIHINCAPQWATGDYQWRDHWMQAVYFPQTELSVLAGTEIKIASNHDRYSLWFDWATEGKPGTPPGCDCGMHVAWSRSRIGQLNSKDYCRDMATLAGAVYDSLPKSSAMGVVISDASYLPFLLSKQQLPHYHIDRNPISHRVMTNLYKSVDKSSTGVLCASTEEVISQIKASPGHPLIGAVVAEPYFISSLLPWHNLHFWYALEQLRPFLTEHPLIAPQRMRLRVLLMDFRDLWKIRASVGADCEGFNLCNFDSMVSVNAALCQASVEPQPLWQYPGWARSADNTLLELNLTRPISESEKLSSTSIELRVVSPGPVNGVALWSEWELLPGLWQSSGLREPIVPGDKPRWNRYCQQGVYLCPPVSPTDVRVSCSLDLARGEFDFQFEFVDQSRNT